MDRVGFASRQSQNGNPYDFFQDDIPSPKLAQDKARETFAIENLFKRN